MFIGVDVSSNKSEEWFSAYVGLYVLLKGGLNQMIFYLFCVRFVLSRLRSGV